LALNRAYAPDLDPLGRDYELEGPEAHHLAVVRRARPDDEVELFNGQGLVARTQVVEAAKRRVYLRVTQIVQAERPAREFSLAVAFPKGERADWLVEKCTELGVDRLVPLRTARSVVDPSEEKLQRFRRAVVEACKQSGRNWLMTIEPTMDWPTLAPNGHGGCMLDAVSTAETFRVGDPVPSWFAVGPEGGWTDAERAIALEQNWRVVRFSGEILRIETAAVAAAVWGLLGRDA
jgi:16S rRNA (uracil1498-N3)-methyltransferase